MKIISTLLMTLYVASVLTASSVWADIINQETFKTHLRWNLIVPRDQLFVVKKDQTLYIETVNLQLFEDLAGEMAKLQMNGQYVQSVSYSKDNFPARPATVSVKLKDPTVELFSFYRDADKKYILDFWINSDLVSEKNPPVLKKPLPLPSVTKAKVPTAEEVSGDIVTAKEKEEKREDVNKNDLLTRKSPLLSVLEVAPEATEKRKVNPEYRDFRYGASFQWDYSAMIPQLEKDINLNAKIPDSLYPIKDRESLDDPKEAHMQLTINFYRDGRWGLMNKSIGLYEKKYGRDSNHVINEFIKANALLKDNITKPNRGITQSAMLILSNIKDLTTDYDLKSAIYRYLIQYNVDQKDWVRTLELSKQFYVEARENFDQTIVIQSALTILHSLAELKQTEKITQFLTENRKVDSILPPQMSMAYMTFAMLSKNETKDIIKKFQSVEKSLVKPIHPAILFNVAESYFRHAEYESAIKIYDELIASYSYILQAPYARLRLALAYELMERPASETLLLYKNAIDRSTSAEVRYEAKLRYVAMRVARKLKHTEEDIETEVFLEQSPDESKAMNQNLKRLLWLVRLRFFIATRKYEEALAYLTTIPLDSLKPVERRMFEGDGAEIVFGLIQDAYLKEDYSKVVKFWEVYKDKYETKVAKNTYMNFVVCDAFIKLGLYKSYDRALANLKGVEAAEERSFPVWVDRMKSTEISQMIEELSLIRVVAEGDYQKASGMLTSFPVSLRDSVNYSYYAGVVHFHLKNYRDAVVEFEKVLVKQNPKNRFTPRQTADLLMSYVESLYNLKDQNRFKTVVRALSADIRDSKSASILNVSERITYLLIEAYAGEVTPDWKELESMTKDFREKFQKSPYTARMRYLYGLSLIKNAKVAEGKEVLNLLTNDNTVPVHIKEMSRSELTALQLTDKNL